VCAGVAAAPAAAGVPAGGKAGPADGTAVATGATVVAAGGLNRGRGEQRQSQNPRTREKSVHDKLLRRLAA
jgi:hypothetical protein